MSVPSSIDRDEDIMLLKLSIILLSSFHNFVHRFILKIMLIGLRL